MGETLANNLTKKTQARHSVAIFISDSPSQEGDAISSVYSVSHVVVNRTANKIAYAKIQIEDGIVAQHDFPISNSTDFAPGKFITLKMGDINEMETIFKGVIIKHGVKIKKFRNSVLTLDCRDVIIKTTTLRKNKYFPDKTTDTDAFKSILGEYSPAFDLDLEDIETEHEGLVQYNCTDWDYILRRSASVGQLIYTDCGVFKSITPTIESTPAFTLEWGDTIVEFEAEIDARSQFANVNLSAWDSSKQELLEEELGELSGIELEKPGNITSNDLSQIFNEDGLKINYPGQLLAAEMKSLVKAELIKSKLSRIRGRVSFSEPTIVPVNSTIELKGVGERFNGLTYVCGVQYEFSKNMWTTNLQFGLERDWYEQFNFKNDDPTQNQIPKMAGLHIGIVTALVDELGEDRIKVRVPTIDLEGEGIWARMARSDAGEHRGHFYLPELDDEVLIGFLGGDPRYPMIVGMLNSSAKPAPVEAKEEDNLKGYYSKIGARLEFDDKKRTVKLQSLSSSESDKLADLRSAEPELEKNNTIVLDDDKGTILIQDKNKNYILFGSDEILIFGDKKITLESKEINIKASSKLVTDTGKSELVSSGETKIQGSTINLNP